MAKRSRWFWVKVGAAVGALLWLATLLWAMMSGSPIGWVLR